MVAPAVERVLTDEEVARFHEHGYVLVKGCLTREECERYRRSILDMVPRDLTIPAHWGSNAGRIKPMKEDGRQSFEEPALLPLLFNERLYAAAAQLLGDHRLRSFDASLGVTIRNASSQDTIRSQTPHLDCSVPADVPFRFTLEEVQVGGCYYFTDVLPTGGGIHVMPGGHRWVEEQVRAHGGGESTLEGRQLHHNWKRLPDVETVEVTGEAGDFALLHHLMPHAASHNRLPTARVAQFTRFTRADHPHYPQKPAEPGRWSADQITAMTPLGKRLLGVEPWN